MALQKTSFTDSRGVDYNNSYWTINTIFIDRPGLQARVNWQGYKDAAAAEAGRMPIDEHLSPIVGQPFVDAVTQETLLKQNVSSICHSWALAEEFFSDATEV